MHQQVQGCWRRAEVAQGVSQPLDGMRANLCRWPDSGDIQLHIYTVHMYKNETILIDN
jgi:hypothetical protein